MNTLATTAQKVQRLRSPQQAPCLCLECKRPECHGIGKPLSHAAAIQAQAAVEAARLAK